MGEPLKAKPLHEYSKRHLRRYRCGACDLRADKVAKGHCACIHGYTRYLCRKHRQAQRDEEGERDADG